eukprot:scaffold2349_cov407-Prasinococcus_capsulatus_cf.AAC.13
MEVVDEAGTRAPYARKRRATGAKNTSGTVNIVPKSHGPPDFLMHSSKIWIRRPTCSLSFLSSNVDRGSVSDTCLPCQGVIAATSASQLCKAGDTQLKQSHLSLCFQCHRIDELDVLGKFLSHGQEARVHLRNN